MSHVPHSSSPHDYDEPITACRPRLRHGASHLRGKSLHAHPERGHREWCPRSGRVLCTSYSARQKRAYAAGLWRGMLESLYTSLLDLCVYIYIYAHISIPISSLRLYLLSSAGGWSDGWPRAPHAMGSVSLVRACICLDPLQIKSCCPQAVPICLRSGNHLLCVFNNNHRNLLFSSYISESNQPDDAVTHNEGPWSTRAGGEHCEWVSSNRSDCPFKGLHLK